MNVATPELPRSVQVEVTGACNLACSMCLVRYRPKLGRREGAMCFHTFAQLLDGLPGLERVTLQGLGEPLLAPDLDRMVEYAQRKGAEVGFNTNGMLLNRRRARVLVEAGLSWLHISLDGATAETYESIRQGASFQRVCTNAAGLVEVMRELDADNPRLSIVFVAMRRNIRELPRLVRLVHELGIDRLHVQNLSHSFSDTDPAGSYADIRRFAESEALWSAADLRSADQAMAQARVLAEDLGVEMRLPRTEESEVPSARGCDWPFTSAYVTHRGDVQPCCMVMGAERAVLGNVEETQFDEIWAGESYAGFRDGLVNGPPPEVCSGCSLYRGVF